MTSAAPALAPAATFPVATRLSWNHDRPGYSRIGGGKVEETGERSFVVWPGTHAGAAFPTCGHLDPASSMAAVWMDAWECAVCQVEREGVALHAAGLEADANGGVVSCHGTNHRHTLPVGRCTGCGDDVARNDRGNLVSVMRRDGGGRQAVCWSGHRCTDYARASWALVRREHAAQGVIHKGDTVRVVKGRKLAKGTVAVVRWIGEDSYNPDAKRLGLAVEGQAKLVYVTSTNVEVV